MTSEAFPQFELHVSQHRNSEGLKKLKDQNVAINRFRKMPKCCEWDISWINRFSYRFEQIITKGWTLDAGDEGKVFLTRKNK